jgi:hypothetical protein
MLKGTRLNVQPYEDNRLCPPLQAGNVHYHPFHLLRTRHKLRYILVKTNVKKRARLPPKEKAHTTHYSYLYQNCGFCVKGLFLLFDKILHT